MKHFLPHPVIQLPPDYPVFDLSDPLDVKFADTAIYGVGRYNEKRGDMYKTPLFEGTRNIHMGIDFFGPVGTPVHSFCAGKIHLLGNNDAPGDYGFTLITEHGIGETSLYALYGHLSAKSLEGKIPGREIQSGEIIGWIGDRHENGGWTPHLHFQLSLEKPDRPDLPGVVSEEELPGALLKFPDPRIVLGPIYF